MHQLIRVIAEAKTPSYAADQAYRQCFVGRHASLCNDPYDYGKTMDDPDARFRDDMPEEVLETGAIRADTEGGRALIERGWELTKQELRQDFDVIEYAVENLSFEEILDDPQVDDVPRTEPYETHDGRTIETTGGFVRHAMQNFGAYRGPNYYIYQAYGESVRTPSNYERLVEAIEAQDDEAERPLWVVPMDVHY